MALAGFHLHWHKQGEAIRSQRAGFQAVNGGSAYHWGNFPRLRAKLTHMVGHLPSGTSCPCRDGILFWLDVWPVRWRAGAQAWLDA
jgi:hypothetical protein